MNNRRILITIAMIAVLTVVPTLLHGMLDGRWLSGSLVKSIASDLPNLPKQVGPWTLVGEEIPLQENAARILQCYGYSNREYWNSSTGERVSVVVLFGPRGPIAVHTPEICYSSGGREPIGPRVAKSLKTQGSEDVLWNVQFSADGSKTPTLDVWYAWTDGRGPWQATDFPRFWPTNSLYKIQLASPMRPDGKSSGCKDFLEHFLPVVRGVIKAT